MCCCRNNSTIEEPQVQTFGTCSWMRKLKFHKGGFAAIIEEMGEWKWKKMNQNEKNANITTQREGNQDMHKDKSV